MYAVEVTRQAGRSRGHVFQKARMLLGNRGEDMTFESREAAQTVATHYTIQYENDLFAICEKSYRVVEYEDWT